MLREKIPILLDELASGTATAFDFLAELRIHQRTAPVRRGTHLLRRQTQRTAQVGAIEFRFFEFRAAQNCPRQERASQIRFLQVRVEKDCALELRPGQICFRQFCR